VPARTPDPSDTIVAISTPPGEGGIGIVRLSGPASLEILRSLFAPTDVDATKIESHRVYRGVIFDHQSQHKLDDVLAVAMMAPKTYTGEDVVEISCHGSKAILDRVVQLALGQRARLANRGEFTKRAFLNHKLDLSQAEAVIDLIKAKTQEAASIASSQLFGGLSERITAIREDLLGLLATIEASIDFPDDVKGPDTALFLNRAGIAKSKISDLLKTADAGRILREGVRAAIIGKPNVGKSCLLNALLKFDRAIVSPHPGTTRDTIEESANIKGVPLIMTDTAGIREAKDDVEALGIERAKRAVRSADLILAVIDMSEPLDGNDKAILKLVEGRKAIIALNKSDKGRAVRMGEVGESAKHAPVFEVSALYGKGVEALEKGIYDVIMEGASLREGAPAINLRHKECLLRAQEALDLALKATKEEQSQDLISIDLKEAVLALGEVVGEAVTEEVIDKIFAEFCVGK
jgi:tRNA modification GTPase